MGRKGKRSQKTGPPSTALAVEGGDIKINSGCQAPPVGIGGEGDKTGHGIQRCERGRLSGQ